MTLTDAQRGFGRRPLSRTRDLLDHPLSTYYLIAGSTLLLLTLGVVMVLSASSIESYRVFGSAYTLAQRQGSFAIVGVIAMFLAARTSVQLWRGLARGGIFVSIGLLIAVLVIGVEVYGQRNWIEIFGPFRFQPSEFAKIALILWGADLLARRDQRIRTWGQLLIPILPVTLMIMVLVLLEGDYGNAMVIGMMVPRSGSSPDSRSSVSSARGCSPLPRRIEPSASPHGSTRLSTSSESAGR